MRRHSISRGKSKHMFSRGASRIHPKNLQRTTSGPMRGGIRL